MIPRLAFLGLYSIGFHPASVFLIGLGGIVDKFENAVASWIREAGEKIDGLFDVAIEIFLHVENPYGVPKANEAWMNSFEVALAIFPVMIILGLLSMPFAEEQKTSLWRQGLRIVGVIAIIAVSRPLMGFGVDLSNTMVTALMPTGTDLLNVINPFSAGMGSLSNVMSGFALALVIWFIGWYSLIAVGIVLVLLELRVFFIYLVYIASPVLAVFWYADWGLLESVNEFANKWARMGIYTLLSGPIIAIIFRTMVVIADGALMQGADGMAEGVAAFWSQFILVTCFPIIMIAAIWKIVSWAGEPIGAGQAMTGMTMAFGAAIGGAKGALGDSGSAAEGASSGSQAGQQASSMVGSGGGGGGGGSGSGSAPGVASDAGGASPGQNSVAQAVQDQEGETVSASGDTSGGAAAEASSTTASASGVGAGSQGGLNGDVPGGTGGSEGPSDEVTGTGGPSGSEEEPQGYISAAKEQYGNFKERNAAKMKDTVSNYKDRAKDRLNPTNLERHYADHKRNQAEGVEQQRQQFEGAVDMEAGENGAVDLAQAEESGALSDSVKATNYDTSTSPTAELNEDGTFQYRNENDEMVTGSVGAKRQQFRDEKAQLESQAEAHEARADSIDESMSHTGSRLKKTGSNVKNKYGPAIQASRQAFGQEMVRGTVGAHSPYLMAGGEGIFGGGQRGGGGGGEANPNPDVGTHEHEESANRPNAAISPSTAKEHEDVLAESGDRFDAMGEELNYVPGGGRTPEGVAQQGYVETAEGGERIGAVEVGEGSDVRLPTDDSFRMGNVKMGKRDGSQAQSLPEESGEYGTFQMDEHSRLLDENETRVDQVVGNDEMVGEEAQFKDMLIRKADSDPEDYAAQYYGESPSGERMPINAPNEETEQVMDDHLGERADLTGTVQNEYGMSTNTHPEYEGAHDYAALEVDLADQGEGGSPNTTSEGGDASSAGEASTESATSTGTSSASSTGSTGHSINASSSVGDSSSGGGGSSTSSSSSGHEISQSSGSGSSSSSGSGGSTSGGASGESMSAEEMIEKGGEGPDRVSSDDTFVVEDSATGSDKHANAYKLRKANEDGEAQGDPITVTRMGAEAGPPELDEPEDPPAMRDQHGNDLGRQDPQPGDVVTDLDGFKYGSYGEEWNGSHEGVDASNYGGEEGKYTELRPDEESSLTVMNRGDDSATDSGASAEATPASTSSSSSAPESGSQNGGTESTDSRESTESTSETSSPETSSSETRTEGSPSRSESHSSSGAGEQNTGGSNASSAEDEVSFTEAMEQNSGSETAASETGTEAAGGGEPSSVDYGGTVEAGERNIPTDDIDGVDSVDGERVDAKGVGGSDILGDAQLESGDQHSNSHVWLADKTNEHQQAEYGEGALSDVEEGESFEIKNGEVSEFNDGSHTIEMDENTAVEKTDSHDGDPTVSIGSEREGVESSSTDSGDDHNDDSGDGSGGGGIGGSSSDGPDDGGGMGGASTSSDSAGEDTSHSVEPTHEAEGGHESASEGAHVEGAASSGIETEHETAETSSEPTESSSGGGSSTESTTVEHSHSHEGGDSQTVINSEGSEAETTQAEDVSVEEGESGKHSQSESHSSGAEASSVSTQQIETGSEIEEVEVVDEPEADEPDSSSGESGGDGTGEVEGSESGDEDHPRNPGSGASTAGERSGDVEDASEWEERARNWREHNDESESETLSEGDGFTAESMRVETLDDEERVFITDYDDLDQSLAEEDIINPVQAEELKHQSLVGHEWTESMGQEVPNVAYNEDTNEIIQQEAGGADTETWSVNEAPDEALEQVDREDYEETMAVQLLGGNLDTNEDNVHVDENGGLHVIDFDRTASSMGEVDNADEMEINAGAAGRVGEKIGKVNEDFHTDRFEYESEVTSKAADIATELEENGDTEDVLASVEEVDEMHSGDSEPRTPVIRHNIESMANEEVEIESSSGASQEELDEIFDELDEEEADGEEAEE
jgi:hypothetical protein